MTARINLTKRPLKHEVAILDLFGRCPMGCTRFDVAEHIGVSAEHAGWWLRRMRDIGLAAVTQRGGRSARWTAPEHVQHLVAEIRRRQASDQRGREQRQIDRWLYPVHSVVPARDRERPISRAPISVFHITEAA